MIRIDNHSHSLLVPSLWHIVPFIRDRWGKQHRTREYRHVHILEKSYLLTCAAKLKMWVRAYNPAVQPMFALNLALLADQHLGRFL